MITIHISDIVQGMVLRVATKNALFLDHRGVYEVSKRVTGRGYSRSTFLGQVIDNTPSSGYLTLHNVDEKSVIINYANISNAHLQLTKSVNDASPDGQHKFGRPKQYQLVTF